ncbi:hypothetical protein B0H34DRAFT_856030 [Crassisporium funariophilum]|nr:hypothetical protein B0H34DRAFT_856030 [Crassisporium funariophilum]
MPLQMNGVEAWITVDNKVQLAEYEVDVDCERATATCWISGEPGQTFAIRWRELHEEKDISGFVIMDGYELGGRVLQASSHASAIFSRIATSPTSCLPLTFSALPRSAGIGADWKTLGAITLDIHEVQIGEAKLHEGFSSYYRRDEGSPLSSATPFSSTEVSSLGKIASFVFKYRPMDVLRYHSVVPNVVTWESNLHLGDKRRAPESEDNTSDEEETGQAEEYIRRLRPRRPLRAPYYGPQTKRMKI